MTVTPRPRDMRRSAGAMTPAPKPDERANGHAALAFAIDVAESRRFLSMLDSEAGVFLFASGDDDKDRRKRLIAEAKASNAPKPTSWIHRQGVLERVHPWLTEQHAKGWGAFVSAQAMRGSKCRKEELAYIRCVVAEMDIASPLLPWPLEPSLIVETSPGRSHVYWLIDAEHPLSADDFSGVMMRLVETYGSDPDAKDLARRMRMPGSWNMKPGREPHLVRVIHENGSRYCRDKLLTAFPPPPRQAKYAGPRPTMLRAPSRGLERFVGENQDGPLWSIAAASYGDWLRVGFALHHESGGGSDGLALWDQWSAQNQDKWSPGACDDKWKSFGSGRGVTGGTIFGMAEERGWRRPLRQPVSNGAVRKQAHPTPSTVDETGEDSVAATDASASAEVTALQWPETTAKGGVIDRSQRNIKYYLDQIGVSLRYDAFSCEPLIARGDATERIDDERITQLRMAMNRAGLNPARDFLGDAIHDLALSRQYHPVRDYLDGLKWDGKPRLNTWVSTYLGAPATALNHAFGRYHLLGAVKRVRSPGCKKDEMLVFEGPQGIGKSTVVQILGGAYSTDALRVGDEAKVIIELTQGVWLAEFSELEGMSNRDSSRIKSMLASAEDKARLSYGKRSTIRQRQWVAFGTTNETDYLKDPSGNRRFWPIKCGAIDLAGLARDRDQIWAEANERIAAGEDWMLPSEFYDAATEAQSERSEVHPMQYVLEPLLEGCSGRVAICDLFARLNISPERRQDPKLARALRAVMTSPKMGWRKDRQRGWDAAKPDLREHCYVKGDDPGWVRFR